MIGEFRTQGMHDTLRGIAFAWDLSDSGGRE